MKTRLNRDGGLGTGRQSSARSRFRPYFRSVSPLPHGTSLAEEADLATACAHAQPRSRAGEQACLDQTRENTV